MGRPSITERHAALAERGAALAANAPAAPSPVHARTVEVLSSMLTMGSRFSGEEVPLQLRTMMRTLNHLKPMLLEQLGHVPAEEIKRFLGELIAEMQTIVDAPSTEEAHGNGHAEPPAGGLGTDLAPTA